MEVDSTSAVASTSTSTTAAPRHTNLDDTNLIDDDDLQASLARTRREAAKKRSLAAKSAMSIDRVVIKQESDDEDETGRAGENGGFVINDMTEFVQRIGRNEVIEKVVRKAESSLPASVSNGAASIAPVIKQEPSDEMITEVTAGGWGPAREDGEESDDDTPMTDSYARLPEDEDIKPDLGDALPGTAGEALVSKGMASTLTMLRQQGLMKTRTHEELEQDRLRKEKASWLALKAKKEREREEEAMKRKGDSRTQLEREYDNRQREQVEARETMAAFNSYKPVVDIKYHDEHGRDLNTKEVRVCSCCQ